MSWGTHCEGTVDEVKAKIETDFATFAGSYPPGTQEGDDIVAVKVRVLAHLDAIDLTPDTYYDGELVVVDVHGSHSWSREKEHPISTSFAMTVNRKVKQ